MTIRKIGLSPFKRRFLEDGNTLKGQPLRPAVSIGQRFVNTLHRYVNRMIREAEKEIIALFNRDDFAGSYGMDANIGSQARIVLNGLYERFEQMFDNIAKPTADGMIDQIDKNSQATLKSSLKELSGSATFAPDFLTAEMQEIISAGTYEAVHLIKRVPAEYLDSISTGVYQAITSGNGLADVVPLLQKQGVKVRNWSKNVAMDQTRKVYHSFNRGRLTAIGVEEYEWVHSGGSNYPRHYHKDVLNGKIFRYDDPPIIDPKTKERGEPSQLYFCRCVARPVVRFS